MMKKTNRTFWIYGLLVLTVCGGTLALNQHSQHKHTSVTASQHLHRGTKGKSTSSSAKKKEGDKRLDLFQLPNKKKDYQRFS